MLELMIADAFEPRVLEVERAMLGQFLSGNIYVTNVLQVRHGIGIS